MYNEKILQITVTVKTRCLQEWADQVGTTITGDWYDSLQELVEHQFNRDLQAFEVLAIDDVSEVHTTYTRVNE